MNKEFGLLLILVELFTWLSMKSIAKRIENLQTVRVNLISISLYIIHKA
jgi:hypothetical protein